MSSKVRYAKTPLISTCCVSRVGLAKKRYATLSEAQSAADKSTNKFHEPMEPYPCTSIKGTYHLRKKR